MRPTEDSNEATVCYKHCPDSYVGVDIPVTKLSQSKRRTSWQLMPEPLPHLNELNQTRLLLPKGSQTQTPRRRTPHQHVNFGQMLFDLQNVLIVVGTSASSNHQAILHHIPIVRPKFALNFLSSVVQVNFKLVIFGLFPMKVFQKS